MDYSYETVYEESIIELYNAEMALHRTGYIVFDEEKQLVDRVNEAWTAFSKAKSDFFGDMLAS